MELPELTKQYKRREAKIDGDVIKWFENNYPHTVALEIKVKGGKLLDHQRIALSQVQNGAFSYKIPDMGRRNPFDGFVLKGAHAYKVTCEDRVCEAERIDGGNNFTFKI